MSSVAAHAARRSATGFSPRLRASGRARARQARPTAGAADVLPTGRNLFAVDPRAVPTRAAHAQGIKLAEELLRRHLQDHGDWPQGLVVDLWGSATMRTAGEDFAMALHLAGLDAALGSRARRVSRASRSCRSPCSAGPAST